MATVEHKSTKAHTTMSISILVALLMFPTDGLLLPSSRTAFKPSFNRRFLFGTRSATIASSDESIAVLEDGGIIKTVVRAGRGEMLTDGSIAVLRYRGYVGQGKGAPLFTKSDESTLTVGDGNMIPGNNSSILNVFTQSTLHPPVRLGCCFTHHGSW